MKMRVVEHAPPLRVCTWCNRNDRMPPDDRRARRRRPRRPILWTGSGGHDYPHPWALFDCLHMMEPASPLLRRRCCRPPCRARRRRPRRRSRRPRRRCCLRRRRLRSRGCASGCEAGRWRRATLRCAGARPAKMVFGLPPPQLRAALHAIGAQRPRHLLRVARTHREVHRASARRHGARDGVLAATAARRPADIAAAAAALVLAAAVAAAVAAASGVAAEESGPSAAAAERPAVSAAAPAAALAAALAAASPPPLVPPTAPLPTAPPPAPPLLARTSALDGAEALLEEAVEHAVLPAAAGALFCAGCCALLLWRRVLCDGKRSSRAAAPGERTSHFLDERGGRCGRARRRQEALRGGGGLYGPLRGAMIHFFV